MPSPGGGPQRNMPRVELSVVELADAEVMQRGAAERSAQQQAAADAEEQAPSGVTGPSLP